MGIDQQGSVLIWWPLPPEWMAALQGAQTSRARTWRGETEAVRGEEDGGGRRWLPAPERSRAGGGGRRRWSGGRRTRLGRARAA